MLLAQIQNLYAYNNWAWDHVFGSLEKLPDEVYKAARPFFWESLHGVTVHSMAAEAIWLARIQGSSPAGMPSPADFADFMAVKERWLMLRTAWEAFLHSLSTEELAREVVYRNTRGNGFTLPLADILLHVANHATEHRSQMTPVLYALGVGTEPLDYMRFCLRR